MPIAPRSPMRPRTPIAQAAVLLAVLVGAALLAARLAGGSGTQQAPREVALAPSSSSPAMSVADRAAGAPAPTLPERPGARDVAPVDVGGPPLLVVTLVDGPSDDPAVPWDWTVDAVQAVAPDASWDLQRLTRGPRLRHALTEPEATGDATKGANWGPTRIVVELGPEVPLDTPLDLVVEASRPEVARATQRWRGEARVELSDASLQRARVVCWRSDPWAAGAVVTGTPQELEGARVELAEAVEPTAASVAALEQRAAAGAKPESLVPFGVLATAPVDPQGAFVVPAPRRAVTPEVRLRVVFADGRVHLHRVRTMAYDGAVRIDTRARPTASGRLLFRGAPALTLATVHAEAGGQRVGSVTRGTDGSFALGALPPGPFEVVVSSARPTGELARFPSSGFTARGSPPTIELGVFELTDLAGVLELTLRDPSGAPAAASLGWRGRSGSGRARLAAQDAAHVLLVPPIVPYELELVPVPPLAGRAVPLPVSQGARTVVVGE